MVKATLDGDVLAFSIKKHLDRLSDELRKSPEDLELLQRLIDSTALLPIQPFSVNLWKPQNIYNQLATRLLPEIKERSDEKSKTWIEKFRVLGEQLGFHIQRD